MGIKTNPSAAMETSTFSSEKPPHHMGIKTNTFLPLYDIHVALKNLPTTWGLRHSNGSLLDHDCALKNLPTTWGLRLTNNLFSTIKREL